MTSDDVVKRMIFLRKSKGWSQNKLALISGVAVQTIRNIEQRKNNLGWNSKTMDKINTALGGTVFGYM